MLRSDYEDYIVIKDYDNLNDIDSLTNARNSTINEDKI